MKITQFGFTTAAGTVDALIDNDLGAGWTPYPTTLSSYTAPFIDPATGKPNLASFAGFEFDMEVAIRMPFFTPLVESVASLGPAMLIASDYSATIGTKALASDILMGLYSQEQMNSNVALETAALTTNITKRYYRLLFRKIDPPAGAPVVTWNPADKTAATTLTSTNHLASVSSGGNEGVQALGPPRDSGKVYIEFRNVVSSGFAFGLGFHNDSLSLGSDPQFSIRNNGNVFVPSGGAYAAFTDPDGHDIDFAIDLDANLGWIRYDNGAWVGASGGADPVTGTNGFPLSGRQADWLPSLRTQFNPTSVSINAGDLPFTNAVPAGYEGWSATPPAAMDGTEIFEILPIFASTAAFTNADYDSIYSKGDRVANGLMTVSQFDVTVTAPTAEAFDNNYSAAAGNGAFYGLSGSHAGAGMSMDFGLYGVFIAGLGWRGAGTPLIDGVWECVGGIGHGYAWIKQHTSSGFTINPPSNDGVEYYLDVPMDSPLWIPWPYYEIRLPYDQTLTGGRFANELWLKVYHSPLDGGDRRTGSKQVLVSTDLTISGISTGVLNSIVNGDVPSRNRGGYAPATSIRFDQTSTAGKYIKFAFPRQVGMTRMVCCNSDTLEVLDSGGNPTVYGMWQWEYSNNNITWTPLGAPWHFSEGAQFMLAPSPQVYATPPVMASYWRMSLVSGPAFDSTIQIFEFIFDLADPGGQSILRNVDFADGDDDRMNAALTLSDPKDLDPYKLAFTDDANDTLAATMTIVRNVRLEAHFDDEGSTFEAYSGDLEPSSFVQTHLFMTGR